MLPAVRPSSSLPLELAAHEESGGWIQMYRKEQLQDKQGQLKVAASSILAKLTCLLVDVYLPPSAYIMNEMCSCGPVQPCYSWGVVCSEFPTCEHNPSQAGTKRKDFIT